MGNSSDQYDSHHAHGIQTEEERHAWESLVQTITMEKSLEILDIGSGTGEIRLLPGEMGHKVSGFYLSDRMHKKAGEKASKRDLTVKFHIGDAESVTGEDQSFDRVLTGIFSGHHKIRKKPQEMGTGASSGGMEQSLTDYRDRDHFLTRSGERSRISAS